MSSELAHYYGVTIVNLYKMFIVIILLGEEKTGVRMSWFKWYQLVLNRMNIVIQDVEVQSGQQQIVSLNFIIWF